MAPRGACLALALALLAAGLALRIPARGRSRRFLREHVDFPRSRAPDAQRYCNALMARRNLTLPFCKPTHTFIHAPARQLRAVCAHAGTCHRRRCASRHAFPLTTCQALVGSRPARCSYRGWSCTRRVRLTCGHWGPVRLDEIL
ncbi:ribonuclease-like [Pelodiscus sinensis]|uniref:ribonuclease-like n=1 Tax=Pelodiscus sinensis TaxID=13735 RepID=UPI003F6D220B